MNKKIIYLSIAATLSMPQLLQAQNVGIGTTTPTAPLEVSSSKKATILAHTDSVSGNIVDIADYKVKAAGLRGEFRTTGLNHGSGVLGVATAPDDGYGAGVTGMGNWTGILGLGTPGGTTAIWADANGAGHALYVRGATQTEGDVGVLGIMSASDVLSYGVVYGMGNIMADDSVIANRVHSNNGLSTNGTVTIAGGNPGAGKVLTSTGTSGAATWQTPATVAPLGFAATKSTGTLTQIGSNLEDYITFGEQQYSQGAAYDNSNDEFTAPTTGLYHFDVLLLFESFVGITAANTGTVDIKLRRRFNYTQTGTMAYTYSFVPTTNMQRSEGFSATIPLTAGEKVDVLVRNNSNGTVKVIGSPTLNKTNYSGYRVQ